jgi:2-keto-4-pentenoate hydratase
MKLKSYVFSLTLIFSVTLTTNVGLFAGEIELADQLLQSHRHHEKIPLVSSTHPNLSIAQAYLVQSDYVKKRLAGEKPAGFKAGLTAKSVQQKFNVNEALAGVLFTNGDLTNIPSIKRSQFKRLMLETELGFEIGKTITAPIANLTELKSFIKAVFPVIELPDLGFKAKPKGIDIIAANVGSAAFIKGQPMTHFAQMDLNTLTVTMTKDGEVVNAGQGSDALGNQWKAALWLVNTVIAQGWALEPGQFLITGAMGKMITAEIGDYLADFGELGNIGFSIVP